MCLKGRGFPGIRIGGIGKRHRVPGSRWWAQSDVQKGRDECGEWACWLLFALGSVLSPDPDQQAVAFLWEPGNPRGG